MDFPLEVPLPDGTLIDGALLLIRGVDEDGNATWFVRTSGTPGNQWERIGFLHAYLGQITEESFAGWQEDEAE